MSGFSIPEVTAIEEALAMSIFDPSKDNTRGFFGKKDRRKFDDPKYTGPERRREMRQK